MATYYSSPNNQRDSAPILYQREQHLTTSYPEASSVISSNMMIYMGSDSYSDALAAAAEIPPPMGGDHGFPELTSGGSGSVVHASSGQGLSLSLGTQIPSGSFRSPSMVGFASFLSPSSSSREEQQHSKGSGGEYLPPPPGFGEQDSSKGEMSSSSPYGMVMMPMGGGGGGGGRAVPSSKYLKAAQQLLDEVVNVRKAMMKQQETEQKRAGSPKEGEDGSRSESTPGGGGGGGDSGGNSSAQPELSHAEKQELQNKLTKLLSMLDEVDRRYKQYYHQMQIVVSSFDAITGGGSAKPYTALALQTISRHFRCLRDAITGQIKATRRSLGEDDAPGNAKGVGISRLRFVDQQLRQQRALQHLGMMQQHAWRPQRGLPENSVSILRAWLFEHFLHPYPKDSDKIMLARQTGLTRSQVSNWFINARVRLWKPMVEEMYKEETGDAADMDSNSSSENASKKGLDVRASADTGEDLQQQQQQSGSSTGTGQFMDSKPDHIPPDVEMAGVSVGGPEYSSLVTMMKQQRREDCGSVGLYPDTSFHSDGGNNERLMAAAAAAAYQMSDMGRYGVGSGGVSLTLGLQYCDGGGGAAMPIPHHQHSFVAVRGHDGMYQHPGDPPPNVGPEGAEFDQPRFASSSHLLHDFVV